jgi:hypothetical protein
MTTDFWVDSERGDDQANATCERPLQTLRAVGKRLDGIANGGRVRIFLLHDVPDTDPMDAALERHVGRLHLTVRGIGATRPSVFLSKMGRRQPPSRP